VTYTSARERDARSLRRSRWAVAPADLALAGASLCAILLIALTWQGRARVSGAPTASVVNLNTVTAPAALERVCAPLFETPADRRLAARELFDFVAQSDAGRRTLVNVGAIARARVTAAAIERTPNALAFKERLREARARAAAAKLPPTESLQLFTASEIAGIKPSLVVRERSSVRSALLVWTAVFVTGFHLLSLCWRIRGIEGDRVLLIVAHLLTAIGFAAMLSRPDPARDTILFVRYTQGVLVGLLVAGAIAWIDPRRLALREFSYLPLFGALSLSVALLLFGSGPSGSTAKVNLGPVQPIEAIRLLLALFLAGYFARNWELLRGVRAESIGSVRVPESISLPRARYAVPLLVGVGAALAMFFLQRDLGPALILSVVFLITYAIARGTVGMALGGAALLAAGFYVGYRLEISSTLADRVRMWQSPWDNLARGGDQVAHAVWAIATGGWGGSGMGLGDTRYLPAGHTDLVLAAVGEELGAIGMAMVVLLFGALVWRAIGTARRATSDYGFFLSIVLALFFAVPAALMTAGILGLLPLTGIVTPFLSFGGSAMVANFAALGLLAAIRSEEGAAADLQPFRRSVIGLAGAMTAAAVVLVSALALAQVIRADELAVRPQLGVQADGTRRFQYNPRVLDIARTIPRGTVFDRSGLPLATEDDAQLKTAAATYERMGVAITDTCRAGTRCYPLGGQTFHLLGDVTTQTNWGASNTSFVERDSEARLRGFDDRQVAVRTTDRTGADAWTLKRDYRALLPLLRHKFDPDHPDVNAFMARPRDVRLTIDARLQTRVAAILAQHAGRSKTGHAAAVVLDPATGDILASVSHPWPSAHELRAGAAGEEGSDPFLDRARYGLYPPGSTFKLMTAGAALARSSGARQQTFTCARLPDGRVGARIPGWSRPIRDDVLDTRPHGTIAMDRALVVSCNAYFAQLALRVGPAALLDLSSRADVTLARGNDSRRIRDTLPQAGYGQGEVLASPIRMARLAAAIASDGRLRDTRLDAGAPTAAGAELMPAEAARLLAGWMRRVVVEGTGRSLRAHPIAIAGKTGTAEVQGAPSHAWFVGFAPAGAAEKRIAFVVLVEHAGYGGTAAAPAAGEIVSAAAALGLVKESRVEGR
jgi:cell division protein FtsW (lipid II flippase)